MKILRKIVVMSSVTGGKEVERYICNRCGRNIKDSIKVNTRRKIKRGNKSYSKLIYIDKCNKCDVSNKEEMK